MRRKMFQHRHRSSEHSHKLVEEVVTTKRKRSYKTEHIGASVYTRYIGRPYSYSQYSQQSYPNDEQPYNSADYLYQHPQTSRSQHSEYKEPDKNGFDYHGPVLQNKQCFYSRENNHGYADKANKPKKDDVTQHNQSQMDEYNELMVDLETFDHRQQNVDRVHGSRPTINSCRNVRKDWQMSDEHGLLGDSRVDLLGMNKFSAHNQSRHNIPQGNDNATYHANDTWPIDMHSDRVHVSTQNRANDAFKSKQKSEGNKFWLKGNRNNEMVNKSPHQRKRNSIRENHGSTTASSGSGKQSYCQVQQPWQPWTVKQMPPPDCSNSSTTADRWRTVPPPPLFINASRGIIGDTQPAPPPCVIMTSTQHLIQQQPSHVQYSHHNGKPPSDVGTPFNSKWQTDRPMQINHDVHNETNERRGDYSRSDSRMHHGDKSVDKRGKQVNKKQTAFQTSGRTYVEKYNKCKKSRDEASYWTHCDPSIHDYNYNALPCTFGALQQTTVSDVVETTNMSDNTLKDSHTDCSYSDKVFVGPCEIVDVDKKTGKREIHCEINNSWQDIPVECIPLPSEPMPVKARPITFQMSSTVHQVHSSQGENLADRLEVKTTMPVCQQTKNEQKVYVSNKQVKSLNIRSSTNCVMKMEHLPEHIPTLMTDTQHDKLHSSSASVVSPGIITPTTASNHEITLNSLPTHDSGDHSVSQRHCSDYMNIEANSDTGLIPIETTVLRSKKCERTSADRTEQEQLYTIQSSQSIPTPEQKHCTHLQPPPRPHELLNESRHNNVQSANNQPSDETVVGKQTDPEITNIGNSTDRHRTYISDLKRQCSGNILNRANVSKCPDISVSVRHIDHRSVHVDNDVGNNKAKTYHISQKHNKPNQCFHRPWESEPVHNAHDMSLRYHFNRFMNPRLESKTNSSGKGKYDIPVTSSVFRPWCNLNEKGRTPDISKYTKYKKQVNNRYVLLDSAISLADNHQSSHLGMSIKSVCEDKSLNNADSSKTKRMQTKKQCKEATNVGKYCDTSRTYKTKQQKPMPFTELTQLATLNLVTKPIAHTESTTLSSFTNSIPGLRGTSCQLTSTAEIVKRCATKTNKPSKTLNVFAGTGSEKISAAARNTGKVKRKKSNIKAMSAETMKNCREMLKETVSPKPREKDTVPFHLTFTQLGRKHITALKSSSSKKSKAASVKTKSNLELGSMQHLKELVSEIKKTAKGYEKSVHLPSLLKSGNGKPACNLQKSRHPKLSHKVMKAPVIAESVNINKVDIDSLPKPSIVVSKCDVSERDTCCLSATGAVKLAKESISNYMKRRKSAIDQISDAAIQVVSSPAKKRRIVHFNEDVHNIESGLSEKINFNQKSQLSKVKSKSKTDTDTNDYIAMTKENKHERETDRQHGLVKRGIFALETPTTLVKLPSKPLNKAAQDPVQHAPDCESKTDLLSQGLCSAKKYLLYRALASEAVNRDGCKPIPKKVSKSRARISNCSLQIGKQIGDKLLEEGSNLDTDLETLISLNIVDSNSKDLPGDNIGNVHGKDGMMTYVNDKNGHATTAIISSPLLHTADTITRSIRKPTITFVSQSLNLPIVCSPFVRASQSLKRSANENHATVIDNSRIGDEQFNLANKIDSSASATVFHTDKNNYSHGEQGEIKDVQLKCVHSDVERESEHRDSPVLVIDDSPMDTHLTDMNESDRADSLNTFCNKVNNRSCTINREVHVRDCEIQPLSPEGRQKQCTSFQEEWKDFCGTLVSVPVSYLEPITTCNTQCSQEKEHTADSYVNVMPLKLPMVKDYKHNTKHQVIYCKSEIDDQHDVSQTKHNKADKASTTSLVCISDSTVQDDVALAATTTHNGKVDSVTIEEEDNGFLTAVPITSHHHPVASETVDHMYPVSCTDIEPVLSDDTNNFPHHASEATQEGQFTESKLNSVTLFDPGNADAKELYVETVCPDTQDSKELSDTDEICSTSERNIFDAMIDIIMTDDSFWTPPELKVFDIAGVLKDEGQSNKESVFPTLHGSEHLLNEKSLNQQVPATVLTQSLVVPVVKTDTSIWTASRTKLETQEMHNRHLSRPFKSARTPPRVAEFCKRKYVKRFPQPLPKSKHHKTPDEMLYEDAKSFLGDFCEGKRRRSRKNLTGTGKLNTGGCDEEKPKLTGKAELDMMTIIDPVTGFLETVKVESDATKQNYPQMGENGNDDNHLSMLSNNYLDMNDQQHFDSSSTTVDNRPKYDSKGKQKIVGKISPIKWTNKTIKQETSNTWKVETLQKRSADQNPGANVLPIVKVKRIKILSESDSDVQIVDVEEDSVTCQLCSRTLKCEMSLRRHYLLAHDSWCMHCNKKFPSKEEKRKHFQKIHMVPTFCEMCGIAAVYGANFSRHLKSASHLEKLAKLNMDTSNMQSSDSKVQMKKNTALMKPQIRKVHVQLGNCKKSTSLVSKAKLKLPKGQKGALNVANKLSSRKHVYKLKCDSESLLAREKKMWYCTVCDHWYTRKLSHLRTLKHDLAVKEGRRRRRAEKRAQKSAANNSIADIKVAVQGELSTQCDTVRLPVQEGGGDPRRLPGPSSPTTAQGSTCIDIPCPTNSVVQERQGVLELSPTFLFKNIATSNHSMTPDKDSRDVYRPMEEMLEYRDENPNMMADQQICYQLQDGKNFKPDTRPDSDDDNTIYIYENLNNVSESCSTGNLQETGSIIKYSTELTLDHGLVSDKIMPISATDDDQTFMQSVMSSGALTVVSMPSVMYTDIPHMMAE